MFILFQSSLTNYVCHQCILQSNSPIIPSEPSGMCSPDNVVLVNISYCGLNRNTSSWQIKFPYKIKFLHFLQAHKTWKCLNFLIGGNIDIIFTSLFFFFLIKSDKWNSGLVEVISISVLEHDFYEWIWKRKYALLWGADTYFLASQKLVEQDTKRNLSEYTDVNLWIYK